MTKLAAITDGDELSAEPAVHKLEAITTGPADRRALDAWLDARDLMTDPETRAFVPRPPP